MKDKVSLATLALAKAYTDEHGGGGGGTSNYNDLTHKPTVNGVEFKGTMTGETLGLVDAENGKGLSANDYTDADKTIVGGVTSALAGKVDKVSGKGLSTNDYSNADKSVVDGVTTALNGKVDKVSGKGLSTNDYSDADKTIVDGVTSALNGKADKTETYLTTDSAETSLTDNDKFPFYDISVTATKHSTWSNIKSKLKTYFDTLYAAVSSVYTKTETDGMINTAQDGIKANTQLIADTVGWSGKNLLGYKVGKSYNASGELVDSTHGVISAIIPVSAGDKFIASKKTALSSADSNMMVRQFDSSLVFVSSTKVLDKADLSGEYTVPSGIAYVGFVQFYNDGTISQSIVDTNEMMLRKAEILDSTYEPYRGTTAFPRDEQRVLGAKNLLKNTTTSKTTGGVTYTVNADKSFTTSGTATENIRFEICSEGFLLKKGKYILNGLNENTASGTRLALRTDISSSSSEIAVNTTIEGTEFTVATDTYVYPVFIETVAGTVNLTVSPMIRLASDPDSTYVPYAMTNNELTLALDGKLDKINGVFDDPAEPIVGDIYNSEEQVVGTWGKQGHEKTLYMSALMSEGNIPFNTENSEILEVESHNIANIDEIVFAQFTCKPSSANVWSPLPHKKKYITIDRTDIIGYTSNSSNEQAAIKGLVYYTKTS